MDEQLLIFYASVFYGTGTSRPSPTYNEMTLNP